MSTILITGGAGFVGSNLSILFKTKYPNYEVIAFDNLKRRGSELNLKRFAEVGVKFIHGDIRNPEDLASVGPITHLIDACAEPSVLAGINSDPSYLINTNLLGTIHCLNYAVKHNANFLFLSTSRVYPIEPITNIAFTEAETRFEVNAVQSIGGISPKGISEKFTLEGFRSLYGSTKLASELLIEEYRAFSGLKTVINRCGVLTGPWQFGKVDQGFMVLWIANHFYNKKLGYFGFGGTGKQVRDILHVKDLFRLVDIQLHDIEKYSGGIYNVGGGREVSVSLAELTKISEKITGNKIQIDSVKEDRVADIRIYLSDSEKIEALSGWKPEYSSEKICEEIFFWLKENEALLKPLLG
jgi:CDP-paratose 2-epimerase